MFKTIFVEKSKKRFMFKTIFSSITVLFMRESDEVWYCQTDRLAIDGKIIHHMRFACWITKATSTHSEYVTFVFPLKQ